MPKTAPLAPGSPYALSKLAQEMRGAARAPSRTALDVIVVRAFNHTGPRQAPAFAAPSFARQIALIERGALPPVIRVGNLDAAARPLRRARRGARLRRADGRAAPAARSTTSPPASAARSQAILDALVARARVAVTVETDPSLLRPNDTAALVGDCTRLRRDTGWSPQIPFEQMLDDLLEYWRAQ